MIVVVSFYGNEIRNYVRQAKEIQERTLPVNLTCLYLVQSMLK